jgi:hypothetical protein
MADMSLSHTSRRRDCDSSAQLISGIRKQLDFHTKIILKINTL